MGPAMFGRVVSMKQNKPTPLWFVASLVCAVLLVYFIPVTRADEGRCSQCTLRFLCWMSGGRRHDTADCSGPSWLYTCCVAPITRSDEISLPQQFLAAPRSPQQNSGLIFSGLPDWTNLGNLDDQMSMLASQNRFFFRPKNPGPLLMSPYNQFPNSQQRLIQHQQQQLIQQQRLSALNSLNYLAATQSVCGIQPLQSTFQKRIIGGQQANFAEFPWQAHIRIAGFQCGGVLLNNHYVATAAHCVYRAKLSQVVVYLGEYDTKDLDKSEILPKETYGVVERKIHPQFKYMLTQPDRYDVALLRLNRPVIYRDNILPICLPPEGKNYEGYVGVVAGWGKTDTSFGKTGTNLLQKVYVPIINNAVCFAWHEQKEILLELHDEMFCAGHEQGKMDACLGDSGGPLVVNDNGRWTLAGITSAGFGCAVDHQPGIYHKISKTVPWLIANILN